MPQLRDVHLYVSGGKIYVNPDSLKVEAGDVVRFVVDTADTTFQIVIHNFDGYFVGMPQVITATASDSAPVSLTVNSSENLVRYYSVCVLTTGSPPEQPDAPPRIIRNT